MNINLYCIRDVKTDLFEAPFPAPNAETAKRTFSQILHNIPTMSNNPEDFNLHLVGDFSDANGQLNPADTVQFICSGISLVQETNQGNANETTQVSNEPPVQPSSES